MAESARLAGLRPSGRGLARALLFLLLLALAGEGSGLLYDRAAAGVGYAGAPGERLAFLEGLPGDELGAAARRTRVVVNRLARELHPYFGYTAERDRDGFNNHGFRSPVDFPYRGAPGELVVGLFGGSVSLQVAADPESRQRLERGLLGLVAPGGFERVRVLSLAGGGWRQPQTFYAFAWYADSLDLAIVLDGFNEVVPLAPSAVREWPARFPWSGVYRHFLSREHSPEVLLVLGELAWLGVRAGSWTRRFDVPVLRSSLLAHGLWRIGAQRYGRRIAELRARLSEPADEPALASRLPGDDEQARLAIEGYFRFYESLSLWQALIARERGLPLVQLLQPNQYVRASKPWSEDEQRRFRTRGAGWEAFVTRRYARLEEGFGRLRGAGVAAFSLAQGFRDTRETLYSDDCCHLNALGLGLLVDHMVDAIAEARVLEGLRADSSTDLAASR